MQVVEEQIVNKIRTLLDKEREDVLRYVNGVLASHAEKKTLGERLAELSGEVSDDVWEKIPLDGSEQHDHYIYGTPKR